MCVHNVYVCNSHPSLYCTELVQDLVVVLAALANICAILHLARDDVQAFLSVVFHFSFPNVQLTLRVLHTFSQCGNE